MTKRRLAIGAALVVLAILTWARVRLIDALPDQGYFEKYTTFADQIVAGQIPRSRLGDLSPAYLWLIVACREIRLQVLAIRTIQIIALSIASFLCGVAAWRFGGWVAAIAAAVAVLGNRAALVIATELEPETIIVLLLSAALAAIAVWQRNLRLRWIVAGGFLLGLAVVARPVAAAAVFLVAGWLTLRARKAAIGFVIAACIPIVVVLATNHALTGSMSIMDPGTGIYDGNNPLASGCAGVLPRIVADLDAASPEPDYLHVAYRTVAARASGEPANRYWSRKSIAWMRADPFAAARLFGRKALLTVQGFDIYDLATTKRKAEELTGWPNVTFGVLFALALAAIVLGRPRGDIIAVALFVLAFCAALVAFNVSARQRDALLPPLAILAAVAIAEIVHRRFMISAVAGVVVVAALLSVGTDVQREEEYAWFETFNASRLIQAAQAARSHGDRVTAAREAAQASVLSTDRAPLVSAPALRAAALGAANSSSPQIRFDAAIALEKSDAWAEAERVLADLAAHGYQPRRENRAVSSVAYYRALAAIHTGRDPRPFLTTASAQAPGDPDVLALAAVLGDGNAFRQLDALHDPFTRDDVLAHAFLETGDRPRALALRDRLLRAFPEWQRPRMMH
ncbi:MAG TPA: hypothetical protein VL284_03620 [Thermoanaerobaculia bacterium]|nr:hypothetical protein [Thermoanaerobaculia bacterium]